VAALENRRTTPAKSGRIKKHYSSYNRTSGSRCCLYCYTHFLSFSLPSFLSLSLSLSLSLALSLWISRLDTLVLLTPPTCRQKNEKWSWLDSERCLFKIHERFYCNLPYRNPSQKGEQELYWGKGERERKIVWPTFALGAESGEKEGERGRKVGLRPHEIY